MRPLRTLLSSLVCCLFALAVSAQPTPVASTIPLSVSKSTGEIKGDVSPQLFRSANRLDGVVDARWYGAAAANTAAQNATAIQSAIDASLPGQRIVVSPGIVYDPTAIALKGRRLDNQARAKLINSVTSGGTLNARMTVVGRFLYVCLYDQSKLAIFSLNDPTAPRLINAFAVGTSPRDVRVVGRFAFVACTGAAKVQVWDLSLMTSPALVGEIATGTSPKALEIVGNRLFVVTSAGATIERYTILALTSSTLTVSAATTRSLTGAQDLAYRPETGVFAVSRVVGPDVYLISALGTMSANTTITNASKQFSTVTWVGDRLYVADRATARLYVYNGEYGSGSLITSVAVSVNPEQMLLVGDFLYVASLTDSGSAATLDVVDVSKPDTPVLVESLPLTVQGAGFLAYYEVGAQGYLYVSGHWGNGKLEVIAIPRGASPPPHYARVVDENGALFTAVNGTYTGDLTGNLAFLATGNAATAVGSGTNYATSSTTTHVRLANSAKVTLHDPATRIGQIIIITENNGGTGSRVNQTSYAGFANAANYAIPANGILWIKSVQFGTDPAQWDIIKAP